MGRSGRKLIVINFFFCRFLRPGAEQRDVNLRAGVPAALVSIAEAVIVSMNSE
jgi:hypothetical protein